MTAVAGDFYEFLPVDPHRAGFLVADVSGHGVPAALIASMIKVAVQSVAAWAHDPPRLLRKLGGALQCHLRGQYVTAAYLWLDVETQTARYSAAGHPPLLRWRAASGTLERIQSNGLLFGVEEDSDYPACEITFARGDRFVLYTDGLTDSESATGAFRGLQTGAGPARVPGQTGTRAGRAAARCGHRLAAGVRRATG
jgi:sigma-B regulation protein RsbU (phosphoserine phosphatase)